MLLPLTCDVIVRSGPWVASDWWVQEFKYVNSFKPNFEQIYFSELVVLPFFSQILLTNISTCLHFICNLFLIPDQGSE